MKTSQQPPEGYLPQRTAEPQHEPGPAQSVHGTDGENAALGKRGTVWNGCVTYPCLLAGVNTAKNPYRILGQRLRRRLRGYIAVGRFCRQAFPFGGGRTPHPKTERQRRVQQGFWHDRLDRECGRCLCAGKGEPRIRYGKAVCRWQGHALSGVDAPFP